MCAFFFFADFFLEIGFSLSGKFICFNKFICWFSCCWQNKIKLSFNFQLWWMLSSTIDTLRKRWGNRDYCIYILYILRTSIYMSKILKSFWCSVPRTVCKFLSRMRCFHLSLNSFMVWGSVFNIYASYINTSTMDRIFKEFALPV